MQKRKPIVHVVKREDFPIGTKGDKGLEGYQRGKHIYVLKDSKRAEAIKHHEIYHYTQKHPSRPKNPRKYIRQELEADMYAKEKTGHLQHIKSEMKGFCNDVNDIYKIPMSKVVRAMSAEMRKKDIPKAWKKDWNEVVKREGYKGRKVPKDVRVKEI